MDIFKLFFDHDLRLDQLAKRNANKTEEEIEASLEDFMKPEPTYSKFYLTGTRLKEEKFGLNVLSKFDGIIDRLDEIFNEKYFYLKNGHPESLKKALDLAEIGDAIILTESHPAEMQLKIEMDLSNLKVNNESNVGHFKEELSRVLSDHHVVAYKEQAHDGFDLHLFSKENIYRPLFYALKDLTDDTFRFFSINSKRMRSERHFYFETWTLDKPPHGAEEVLPETVL